MTEEKTAGYEPIRWSEDSLVMFLDGWAWTCLRIDGEVKHVSLGKEDDVKAMLAGAKPITEAKTEIRVKALARILEIREEEDARATEARGRSLQRGDNDGTSRRKQSNVGRLKTRSRLSRR